MASAYRACQEMGEHLRDVEAERDRLREMLAEAWDYIHGPKKQPGIHNCDRDSVCRIEPCPAIRAVLKGSDQ